MVQGEEEETPASVFPEDVLVEILSRVPYVSLFHFKCVSKQWLALCSDPDVRKRSPKTLSGFFYFNFGWHFQNLSGKDPPIVDPNLRFLRSSYKFFSIQQCSTSLLLCKCWRSRHPSQHSWNSVPNPGPRQCFKWPEAKEFDYVVCNPATQEWTVLPPIELPDHLSDYRLGKYFLSFDPATPSRFVVFVPLDTYYEYGLSAAMIYSSETGGWAFMQSQHNDSSAYWVSDSESTFLNGIMHFPSPYSIFVDNSHSGHEKECLGEIEMPPGMPNNYGRASIGQSHGRLHVWEEGRDGCQLSIWVLENYDSGQWTLKCNVNCFELFGRDCCKNDQYYSMFAIHPECDLIFLTDNKEKALSYDMDNQEVHIICATGDFLEGLPYTPSFAEWTSDGH
ncbi:F-box protein At5g49610-like [Aegilops tauschii subsp. strangulata]|uniref:F-box protein At5g49610-like n=1 Tax=Aegilops tauschii subsp. strangulata TaxID=200361 RepID=UPI00098A486F|nr:F-box protein At5g07610-like [Aegilops tauschii subsp. strangulata]XP_044444578.1 F-box protein At5g07610-like [Triticum aestivum]